MTDEKDEKGQEPETEAAAKRERTTYPIRLMRRVEGGYEPPSGPEFGKIADAERHIRDHGDAGVTYLLVRPIGARKVVPRTIEDVPA